MWFPATEVFLIKYCSNLFKSENPIQLYFQPNHFRGQFEIFIKDIPIQVKKISQLTHGKLSLFFFFFLFSCCLFVFFFLGLAFVLVPFGLRMCHSSKASSFVAIFLGSSCGSLFLFSFSLPVCEMGAFSPDFAWDWFNWSYWAEIGLSQTQALAHFNPCMGSYFGSNTIRILSHTFCSEIRWTNFNLKIAQFKTGG